MQNINNNNINQFLEKIDALAESNKDKARRFWQRQVDQSWQSLTIDDKKAALEPILQRCENQISGNQADSLKGPLIGWVYSRLWHESVQQNLERLVDGLNPSRQETIEKILKKKPYRGFVDPLVDPKHIAKYGRVGTLPIEKKYNIAVVGAGISGVIAARELAQAGAIPVIFEATDRMGGRLRTDDGAELGGMRFSVNERAFYHYLKLAGIRLDNKFPVPGQVPTKILFEGKVIDWDAGKPHPNDEFLKKIYYDDDNMWEHLIGPLREARKSHDPRKIESIMQSYINKYEGKSLEEGMDITLKELDIKWGEREFGAFGAVGSGYGGQGSLFSMSFLDTLRLFANNLGSDPRKLDDGAEKAVEIIYNAPFIRHDGKEMQLHDYNNIRYDTVADYKTRRLKNGKERLYFEDSRGKAQYEDFDAVILTPQVSALRHQSQSRFNPTFRGVVDRWKSGAEPSHSESIPEHILPTGGIFTRFRKSVRQSFRSSPFENAVQEGVDNLHVLSSSKLWVTCKEKVWEEGMPRIIISDGPARVTFVVEDNLVLAMYGWGKQSEQQAKIDPEKRLESYLHSIAKVDAKLASNIKQYQDRIVFVDWQREPYQHGGYAQALPGQEKLQQQLYEQHGKKQCTFIGGDGTSLNPGFVEGAVIGGLSPASRAVESLTGSSAYPRRATYKYDSRSPRDSERGGVSDQPALQSPLTTPPGVGRDDTDVSVKKQAWKALLGVLQPSRGRSTTAAVTDVESQRNSRRGRN